MPIYTSWISLRLNEHSSNSTGKFDVCYVLPSAVKTWPEVFLIHDSPSVCAFSPSSSRFFF